MILFDSADVQYDPLVDAAVSVEYVSMQWTTNEKCGFAPTIEGSM